MAAAVNEKNKLSKIILLDVCQTCFKNLLNYLRYRSNRSIFRRRPKTSQVRPFRIRKK